MQYWGTTLSVMVYSAHKLMQAKLHLHVNQLTCQLELCVLYQEYYSNINLNTCTLITTIQQHTPVSLKRRP